MIDAEQRFVVVSRLQSSLAVEPDTDRCPPMTSAIRDSPSASNGLLTVTTAAAARQGNDAETQTPPSVRDFRRSLIDYSKPMSPLAKLHVSRD